MFVWVAALDALATITQTLSHHSNTHARALPHITHILRNIILGATIINIIFSAPSPFSNGRTALQLLVLLPALRLTLSLNLSALPHSGATEVINYSLKGLVSFFQ